MSKYIYGGVYLDTARIEADVANGDIADADCAAIVRAMFGPDSRVAVLHDTRPIDTSNLLFTTPTPKATE